MTNVNQDRYSWPMTEPPRDPRIPDLVSLHEAADIMGVTRQYAHKMVKQGLLRGAKVGGTWVFRKVVVERHRKTPSAE